MLQMLSTPTPSHTGKNSQANASYSLFDDVMQALQTLQTAKGSTDIEFWVGETGWPTDGSSYGDSVPSVENAADQWQKVSVLLELGVLMLLSMKLLMKPGNQILPVLAPLKNTGVFGNPTKL